MPVRHPFLFSNPIDIDIPPGLSYKKSMPVSRKAAVIPAQNLYRDLVNAIQASLTTGLLAAQRAVE